ncbi:MAG: NAD(P)/FAD-dependent oxidoreductase [Fimbriimonadaceae bacterium]|nr:MAG: NAD(P)/FAD-dependent oxidoreductase [Fimbriimonadaceae bacterium]
MGKRVVIVGGGFGGMACARALKGRDVRVTLLDRENHHLFQPLLYQVATAGLSPADIAWPIRGVLSAQKNTEVFMTEVEAVDLQRREVRHSLGTLPFDALVIATGATHSYFGHQEWETFAPGLKTLNDATEIRSRILGALEMAEAAPTPEERRAWLSFVVVGAGPTGVEMAGAISELIRRAMDSDFRHFDPSDACVFLVEGAARVLPGFPEKLSQAALDALDRLDVRVLLGETVQEIGEGSVRTDKGRYPAHVVVWAAGIKAAAGAAWLGVEPDRAGRIRVDDRCRVLGIAEEVYAIGDVAHFPTEDGRGLPGVAQVAIQQGQYVARALVGEPQGPFVYRDRGSLATIGRNRAVADIGRFKFSGFFAWLVWLFVHVWQLLGVRRKLSVLTTWAWAYFLYYRGARLITKHRDS